jgi:hypothetical protein
MAQGNDQTRALAAVEGFTAAWQAQEIARMASFMAEDFTLWNNCSKVEFCGGEAMCYFTALSELIHNRSYYDIRRHLTSTGVVQQNLASFDVNEGRFADIPLMLVFTVRDDLVARCEAYLDSTGLPDLAWPQATPFF